MRDERNKLNEGLRKQVAKRSLAEIRTQDT